MAGAFWGWAHLGVSLLLLFAELAMSVLLIKRVRHFWTWAGFAIQLVGAVVTVLSQTNIWHFKMLGEVLVLGGFSVLFTYNLHLLDGGES